MNHSMQELESKYLLVEGRKPGKALRRLLQDLVWAGFRVHPKGNRHIHDVYWDTPDERLRRAGWSLRCRHRSLALVLTCKQLDQGDEGWFERREIEQTTLHDTPDLQTLEEGPVLDLLRRYVPACRELEPRFEQSNRRTAYHLTHQDFPRAVIELVMDQVNVPGEPALRYVEFEGELTQGASPPLAELAAVMGAQPGLVRARLSKYHRGRFQHHPSADVGDRSRGLLTPDDDWSRLGASYLSEQFQALTAYEPYAWEGLHTEGVHQMRVATRRLRAALKAFASVLPADAAPLAAEARWLCDVLGAVRDLDVQQRRVAAYREALPERRRIALDEYGTQLASDHEHARRCLVAALESRRYARFRTSYQKLLRQLEDREDDHGSSIREFARGYLPDRLARVRKAGRKINAVSNPEDYHRLRIRIKRLRYQLEILEGPYGSKVARAGGSLKVLQSRLGDHQDAMVAQEVLSGYRDQHPLSDEALQTFDWLIRRESNRAASLRNRFQRDWQRFEKQARKLNKAI